ncbi:hypothetical protein J6590_034072 [Homalodisca vitripennis]|nr:hypothetical protein J6590_034072 [Homalodisca vitripennis]
MTGGNKLQDHAPETSTSQSVLVAVPRGSLGKLTSGSGLRDKELVRPEETLCIKPPWNNREVQCLIILVII